MLRNFLLLAVRNFFKNGVYSIINIFGLSVGLASFVMLTLFVKYETSYDSFHDDHERIYRVEQLVTMANGVATWNQVPAQLSDVLDENYPEVEEAITIREIWGEYLSTSKERTFFEFDGFYANPDIFNLLAFDFISGNKETALDAPMKIVLTETLAKKLFPNTDPMGQNILVDSKRTYYVSGVIRDYPFNTNIKLTYLIPFSTHINAHNEDFYAEWDRHDLRVFVKLRENVDEKIFEGKIKYILDKYIDNRIEEVYIKPIWKIHVQQGDQDGYWIAVMLYGIVGLFILVLAALNFVNLTTAYSLTRAKEIGVKKVVGCSKLNLMKQFLGESLIVVFISLLVAFTIAEATLPLFNRIVTVPLEINYIGDWKFILFVIGVTILTGVLSGLYPSLVLSSLNPLLTLKNKVFDSSKLRKFSMRRGLVVFQLIMSILFVLATLGVLDQFKYLKNKDLGFEKRNLLISQIKDTEKVKINDFYTLRKELLELPGITETSLSYNAPFYDSWGRTVNWEGGQAGEKINCRFNRGTSSFIPSMKIEIIAGRNFSEELASDSSTCIVNETFVNIIGWSYEEAIGKKVWDNDYTIVGVMKDFHENSPFTKIKPYILTYHPGYLTGTKKILVRVENISDKESTGRVKAKLEEYFPESNFEIHPYDQNLGYDTNKIYEGMVKTFGFFSVISIIIAIIGLFALVSFSTKRKVKEIGIRKVLGAKPSQIFTNLTKEYIILLIIANAIAIPLGILFYNIDPSYYKQDPDYYQVFWIGLLSLIVTVITISLQIIKSSYSNPINSLRYE
ncbi:ABC transporter permease [Bacteroidota bacterium]